MFIFSLQLLLGAIFYIETTKASGGENRAKIINSRVNFCRDSTILSKKTIDEAFQKFYDTRVKIYTIPFMMYT